jgi:hypothetical protein
LVALATDCTSLLGHFFSKRRKSSASGKHLECHEPDGNNGAVSDDDDVAEYQDLAEEEEEDKEEVVA